MQLTAAKKQYITHDILFKEKMPKEDLKDLVNSVKWKYGIQMINIISISLWSDTYWTCVGSCKTLHCHEKSKFETGQGKRLIHKGFKWNSRKNSPLSSYVMTVHLLMIQLSKWLTPQWRWKSWKWYGNKINLVVEGLVKVLSIFNQILYRRDCNKLYRVIM